MTRIHWQLLHMRMCVCIPHTHMSVCVCIPHTHCLQYIDVTHTNTPHAHTHTHTHTHTHVYISYTSSTLYHKHKHTHTPHTHTGACRRAKRGAAYVYTCVLRVCIIHIHTHRPAVDESMELLVQENVFSYYRMCSLTTQISPACRR